MAEIPHFPHRPFPRQQLFIDDNRLQLNFQGLHGAGKSDGLLMAALRDIEHPDYYAAIFSPDFETRNLPNSLFDRFRAQIEKDPEVEWDGRHQTFSVNGGGAISFYDLPTPRDYTRYSSRVLNFIGFDDLENVRERDYLSMIIRLRARNGLALRARSTSFGEIDWYNGDTLYSALDIDNPWSTTNG